MIKTLHLRLTLWHAAIFTALALFVLVIAYAMVSKQLLRAIDIDLQDTATEFSEKYKTGGLTALTAEIDSEEASHGRGVFFARVRINPAQQAVIWRSLTWGGDIDFPKPNPRLTSLQWFNIDGDLHGGPMRGVSLPIVGLGWLELGISLRAYESQMERIVTMFVPSLLVLLLLSVMATWLQLRTVFRSVKEVQHTALGIAAGDLDRRVTLNKQDEELSQLAHAFNLMLDRIQLLLGEMKGVSDHIAHDLRTPISRIRLIAETTLLEKYASVEAQKQAQEDVLATIIEESEQLNGLINTMLEIAQADAGIVQQQYSRCDLSLLLTDACELFLPAAEDLNIQLSLTLPDEALLTFGSPSCLQRVFSNLIDNALKFSAKGGQVRVSGERHGDGILIHVTDHGIGMSEADLPHVFERFYRSDRSRSQQGNGLGLSYAKSIINSYGGTIMIQSVLDQGSVFTVELPYDQGKHA